MTFQEYKDAELALRNEWAAKSNATNDPASLITLGEWYIAQHDHLLEQAGGHPTPPPPRIRP